MDNPLSFRKQLSGEMILDRNISVVIPLYNKEFSIRRTVLSVLAQTHANFELIIVNDGSLDNSLLEVERFTDSRIRVISQPNAGECAARNRGIYEAKYDLIAFLDADDEWEPGFLEKLIYLRENFADCQVFATAFQYVTENPGQVRNKQNPYPPGWEGILSDYFHILKSYTPFFPSSVAVLKKTLLTLGGFKNGVKLRGDMEMWFRLALTSRIAYANLPLSLYHLDAENRVCNIYKPDEFIIGEHLSTLLRALDKGQVPKELRRGAKEYFSYALLNYAGSNLSVGNPRYALNLLFKWRFFRPDFRRWTRLIYYCLMAWFRSSVWI